MNFNFKSGGSVFDELAPRKTELPDKTVIIYGRNRRRRHGAMDIAFKHEFADPKAVVVVISPNFHAQAGFIETVTKVERDKFTVESNNSHYSDYFISWTAIGQ